MLHGLTLPRLSAVVMTAHRPQQRHNKNTKKPESKQVPSSNSSAGFGANRKEPLWRCVEGCGACCKLAKDPLFATPEEIFTNPSDIVLYRSLIGPDGWCINYEKSTRKCSIYPDRPYFCRVVPEVFHSLYGIGKKKFNKEACNSCRDNIKAIYGPDSRELTNFNGSLLKEL